MSERKNKLSRLHGVLNKAVGSIHSHSFHSHTFSCIRRFCSDKIYCLLIFNSFIAFRNVTFILRVTLVNFIFRYEYFVILRSTALPCYSISSLYEIEIYKDRNFYKILKIFW